MLVHNNQDVNTRPAIHLGSFCPCKVIAVVLGSSSPWFYRCEVVTQAENKRLRARETQRTEKHQFRNNNAKIVPSGNISPETNFAHTSPSRGKVDSRYCRHKIGPFGLTSDDKKGFTDNNRSPTIIIIGNKSSTSSSRSQPPNNRHKLAPLTPHIETEVFVTHNKGIRTGISSTVPASSRSRSVFGKCRYNSSKRIGGSETRACQPIKNKPHGRHLGPIDETDEKLEEFMDAWSSFGGGIFG
jgi:hypothetical protein